MFSQTEKIYTKNKARIELGLTRGKYDQFIESGILLKPIALVEGVRPVHTESQIRLARRNLERLALAEAREIEKRNRENALAPYKPTKRQTELFKKLRLQGANKTR